MASCGRNLLGICGGLALAVAAAQAQRLPIRTYTTADGLARNRIERIVPDSKGFIWICTTEGLSRYDGYHFVNYGVHDGLSNRIANDLLEARDGTYWVATNTGLCRMHPKSPEHLFSLFGRSNLPFLESVSSLAQDHDGVIWAASDAGLYRVRGTAFEWVDIGLPRDGVYAETRMVIEDHKKQLWIAGPAGLIRRYPDGGYERFAAESGLRNTYVETLAEDHEGHLWAGTRDGLVRLLADPQPGHNIVERSFGEKDGLANRDVKSMSVAPDGTIWVGCLMGGITEIRNPGSERPLLRSYSKQQGLSDESIMALVHDREGNLWLGGESAGAMRVVRNGLVTYTRADGLGSDRIGQVFTDREGQLHVAGNDGDRGYVSRFDGERFSTVYPGDGRPFQFGWAWYQIALQDHTGGWWLATPFGLDGFAPAPVRGLHGAAPTRVLNSRDGLVDDFAFRVFEDSRGAIWMSMAGQVNKVGRWDPVARHLEVFPQTNGPVEQLVSAFAEDRGGNIWMGLYGNGVVRYRKGQFTTFMPKDGIPAGIIASLFVDAVGRLWIGSADGGMGRIDDPAAEHPSVRTYDSSHGMSSDSIASIVADQQGRIYAGTGRGLDRLDPMSGAIKHYTTADGLANDGILTSVRDRNGWLWFGTTRGVSRLIPEPDRPRSPPPIVITGLTIAGARYPVSQLGETELSGLEFANGQVQIEFAGLSFEAGESLSYQYNIEGAGNGKWSAPDKLRSVNLAHLSPGGYRFLVRAIDSHGQASATPAAISFRIPPPVWGQIWFQLLVVGIVGATLYAAYRFRLRQVLELERIRMRIATDLHDDIGSSLSQIAILSEVARRADVETNGNGDPLTRIATISRELVDSMADIVWAINPRRDNLLELTRRMRQFAGEMLVAGDIAVTFDAAAAPPDVHLGTDLRRQVFLIFKESITNAARYSNARQVRIAMGLEDGLLQLVITDDGRGFDVTEQAHGHGLASMRSRAEALAGKWEVSSTMGKGTTVTLVVPLTPRRKLRT